MSCTAPTQELPVLHEKVNLQQHCCESIRSSKVVQCSMKEFVYSAVCLTKGPYPLPKPVLQTVRSSASFFNFQHPLFPLRSFNGLLPLSPRLSFTSIFHSLMCYKRQFLRKAQSIQLAFLLFMVCRTFLSSLNEGLVS